MKLPLAAAAGRQGTWREHSLCRRETDKEDFRSVRPNRYRSMTAGQPGQDEKEESPTRVPRQGTFGVARLCCPGWVSTKKFLRDGNAHWLVD